MLNFDDLILEIEKKHSRILAPKWRKFARRSSPFHREERKAWGAYSYGFKLAADLIAQTCLDPREDKEILHAPMFYLYRHALELELKTTWKDLRQRGWLDSDFETSHNIVKLWNEIKIPLVKKGVGGSR